MSRPGTGDEPLDLHAVAADEAALEGLRTGAGDDAALVLLRELMLDVERDLPAPARISHGSTVLALSGEDVPERRLARSGTVVAALTAGLLSLGGVAAATTLAPVASPLHGFGQAVRAAAGAVVGAVSPPESPGRGTVPLPSPRALASGAAAGQPTPGPAVAALARSEAAARQVDQLLLAAAGQLGAGRTTAAVTRLDLAERKLVEVLPVHRGDLAQRLAELRRQAVAASPKPRPDPGTAPAKPAEPAGRPAAEPAAKPDKPAPAAGKRAEPRGSARTAPPQREGRSGEGRPAVGQLSDRAASMKPRA